MKSKQKKILIVIILSLFLIGSFFIISKKIHTQLIIKYNNQKSVLILDRNNKIISLKTNSSDYYAKYTDLIPDNFKKHLLLKEDKYFYYHPGINIFSIARAFKNYLLKNNNLSSSTITQQLIKILLNNEKERTLKNKIIETFYSICLETQTKKDEILLMYVNSIFLGNRTQGIHTASKLYFDLEPEELNDKQIELLINTISNPTNKNPFKTEEFKINRIKELKNNFQKCYNSNVGFELINLNRSDKLTIDAELTKDLRATLKENLQTLLDQDASNGSIVIIKVPENELLAIIGSPDPNIDNYGYKINMATSPRPIGSTIKPFIYLKGFEKNLRPYTLIEDKEYKYTIGSGFSFYPKNYDYEYRGEVDLHYALTNSLNVPTVKVLEYVELDNFYNFMLDDLEFEPVQDLDNYQLGIALGELEMDLLTLSYYFTIFPNEGYLKPLKITSVNIDSNNIIKNKLLNSRTRLDQNKKIANPAFIQLVNKILSDRKTGIKQFGAKSNLNLFSKNYAVKTGTSREYHDSWTVGYTPNFVVGVWVGNSDDSPMDKISGQNGAGKIWHETMNLLLNSKYNKNTEFNFDLIEEFYDENNIVYGLKGDDFEVYKNLMQNDNLILSPHNGDIFLFEENIQIPLKARNKVKWFINGSPIINNTPVETPRWGVSSPQTENIFQPTNLGKFIIKVISKNKEEEIIIFIEE
ncbi:transglycosylase domain-containing protein [Candidatus Parcubacteria bacterium]|nr:transglycosylase domain-containing protein [Candidatus Parcubacteria bacterium]